MERRTHTFHPTPERPGWWLTTFVGLAWAGAADLLWWTETLAEPAVAFIRDLCSEPRVQLAEVKVVTDKHDADLRASLRGHAPLA